MYIAGISRKIAKTMCKDGALVSTIAIEVPGMHPAETLVSADEDVIHKHASEEAAQAAHCKFVRWHGGVQEEIE